MTTELVLLMGLFAFLLVGVFIGSDAGPNVTFSKSAPRLGARVEKQITTGIGFSSKKNGANKWTKPPGKLPGVE